MNVIIDCNYVCYVNRYALSKGLTYYGDRTEIIFGFLQHLLSLSERFDTNRFFFCWDSRESWRKDIYPKYKDNRRPDDRPQEEKEQDLIAYKQFDEIRESILPEMGFKNNYVSNGYESDDLIAILVNQLNPPNIVVSNDNDLFQLLPRCSLFNIVKKQLTTGKEFTRTYGVPPEKWAEVKSIAGCTSDNISGVPGVGIKTALKYIKGELKQGKVYQSITSFHVESNLNLKLIKLPFDDNIVLPIYLKDNLSKESIRDILTHYGLTSLMKEKIWSKWEKYLLRKGK